MTSKEKYQDALIDIRCDTHNFIENNYDDAFKMVYAKQFKLLQELIDQQSEPTLSECIKEWKDDGFEFNKIFCYELINKKKNVGIYFDNEPIGICCNIEGHVTSKQLIRLIKTFKALGWEVEDETK